MASRPDSDAAPVGIRIDPLFASAIAFGLVTFVVLVVALLLAIALPFGNFDALGHGVWSRLIATHWPTFHFAGFGAVSYERPLFYVLQGEMWAVFGFHQWLGRLLSYCFSLVLLGSIAYVATRFVRFERRFAAACAALVLVIVAPFEQYIAAGMTDIPVAAMTAATAAALFGAQPLGRKRLGFVASAAALSVLAKPSAFGALAGLGLALLVGHRTELRDRVPAVGALCFGTAVGLLYDASQASYLHMSLRSFVTSGVSDAPYYQGLANALRLKTLSDPNWLGPDLRLVLAFALIYASLRLVVGHRWSVALALVLGWTWSLIGPHFSHSPGVFQAGTATERVAVVALSLMLLFSLAAPVEAIPERLTLVRVLLWAAPAFASWARFAVYDTRLLAPVWAPLVILLVLALTPAFAGAKALGSIVVLVPAAALAVLGCYAVYGINGLGPSGWSELRDNGVSGITDSAHLQKVGLGADFAAELATVAGQIRPGDRLISVDQRLRFYYVDQVYVAQPVKCADLGGQRIFVLIEADELKAVYPPRVTSPSYWQSCKHPRLTEVGTRPGAFVVFSIGRPRPQRGGCGAQPITGLLLQFGPTYSTAAPARRHLEKVLRAGFIGSRVDQLGCALYRVVLPGLPSRFVGHQVIAEAQSANLEAHLTGS